MMGGANCRELTLPPSDLSHDAKLVSDYELTVHFLLVYSSSSEPLGQCVFCWRKLGTSDAVLYRCLARRDRSILALHRPRGVKP